MFRISSTIRAVKRTALLLCLACGALGQQGAVAPVSSGTARAVAKPATARLSDAREIVFEGTLDGSSALKKSHSPNERIKVGADPCHRQTTDERTRCDAIVDLIAGKAQDDRKEAIGFNQPRGIVTDSKGRVLITDDSIAGIHVFDAKKKKYTVLHLAAEGNLSLILRGIAVDAHDAIYVTEQREGLILVYSSQGKFQRVIGKLDDGERLYDRPSGIAIYPANGHIIVADSGCNCLFIMDANGKQLKRVGRRGGGSEADAFRVPRDVVVSGGSIYVLDTQNRRIQILDTDGNFTCQVALRNAATCLGVDDQGNLYVGNADGGTVTVLDGQTRGKVAEFGRASTTPIDTLSGIWVSPDERVYIANLTQHRVEVFQLSSTRTLLH